MSTPRDIPAIGQSVEAPIRNPLNRIREELQTLLGFRGDVLDKAITLRQAQLLGLLTVDGQGGFVPGTGGGTAPTPGDGEEYEPDLTPPPTVTGLTVTAGFSFVIVEWDAALYTQGHGHGQTNIYAVQLEPDDPTNPTFANAVLVDQAPNAQTIRAIPSELNTRWHIWAKWQSVDGVESVSPAGGTNGVTVTTGQDVGQLLELLNGQITESQLFADLGARINLIDAASSIPGSVNARLLAETNARAQALLDEAAARGAAITSEATTRQAEDESLAATQVTLSAAVADNAAAIATTNTNMVNADLALAEQITLLSAGAGEQFDYQTIWYFDSGVESWTGNGTPTATAGWLRAADQPSDPYVVSPAGIGANGPQYPQVRLRVRKVGTPVWDGHLWWRAAADATWDAGRRVVLDEPTFDGNGIGLVTVTPEWTVTVDRIRVDLTDEQTVTDYFDIDWVAVGRPSPGASSAALLAEQTARAAGDAAEASSRNALATTLRGEFAAADVTTLASANAFTYSRSAIDSSIAASASTLTTAYQAADTASAFTTLTSAQTYTQTYTYSRSQIDGADATQASVLRAEFTAADSATFTSAQAWVQTYAYSRAQVDSAVASTTSTLQAAIAGNTAAIQTEATTRASQTGALFAQYTVKLDVNGYVSGFGLASTSTGAAPTSAFIIRADSFAVASPSGPGLTPITPFVVRTTVTTLNGVTVPVGVYMDAAYILNGSITNAKIANLAVDDAKIANLNAAKITAGTIDAARIGVGTLDANRITSNTITAQQIAAGTITAAQIAAGTITAASGIIASLDASVIQAGTITTDKLLIGSVTANVVAANENLSSDFPAGTDEIIQEINFPPIVTTGGWLTLTACGTVLTASLTKSGGVITMTASIVDVTSGTPASIGGGSGGSCMAMPPQQFEPTGGGPVVYLPRVPIGLSVQVSHQPAAATRQYRLVISTVYRDVSSTDLARFYLLRRASASVRLEAREFKV